MSATLDRFRTAMKFSLWTWALYWPGGGLLLLFGGLDPVSIAITFASLASFIVMLASGALKANSSRNLKEFFVERPLYLVVLLVAFILVAVVLPSIEAVALLLFATTWFGGLAFTALRLARHLQEEGKGVWESRADQLFVVLGLAAFFSALVFLDALLPLVADGATLGSPDTLVAIGTWANLLYPGMVLVASRPFREPLRNPFRRAPADPVGVPAAVVPASAVPVALARRKAKQPQPFKAS